MIRVVADTNVYVSAIVFGGTCESILALARADILEVYISPEIYRELIDVLTKTFGWKRPQVQEARTEIESLATLVKPTEQLTDILSHDQDHRILECAIEAQADFLITGDKKHLLPLKTFRGVRIISPREFLNTLRLT